MTACPGKSSRCEGGPVLPFTENLRGLPVTALMCGVCADTLNAMGSGWVFTDRRRTVVPVIHDRRVGWGRAVA